MTWHGLEGGEIMKYKRKEVIGDCMLYHGDCLEKMKEIPDGSVDMVLTDPPYGTTACKWDSVIPFEPMWEQIQRITKQNGAIVLFGSEPFSSALRMSNIKNYKYDWIWVKEQGVNQFLAKIQPLRQSENISVFYKKQSMYNRQMKEGTPYDVERELGCELYGEKKKIRTVCSGGRVPTNILRFDREIRDRYHPTQKPVALMEYLIKTYTNEGETVLDFTMGSGTTGVACKNLNRKFIGIEKDDKYFEIAKKRIEKHEVS